MNVNAYSPQYLSAFRPEGYGKVAAAKRAAPGPQAFSNGERPADKDTHRIMASELVRRLDLNSLRNEDGAKGKGFDESKHLQLSMSKAFNKVEKEFGHAASVAVMGIFAAAVDDGGVSEEAIGEAMLDSVRFMDRNFGFAAGDKLMGMFNRDLNKRVNQYFDNGFNEQIYVKGDLTGAITKAVNEVSAIVMERFGQEDAEAVTAMISEALEESGGSLGGALRSSLRDAAAYLEEKYGAEAVAGLGLDLAQAAYSPAGGDSLEPGSFLNATV